MDSTIKSSFFTVFVPFFTIWARAGNLQHTMLRGRIAESGQPDVPSGLQR
ncbi:hypothetical protein MKZ24_25325 [Paenibacillus sp. FSL R7-0297]